MKPLTAAQLDLVHPLRGDKIPPFGLVEAGGKLLRSWRKETGIYWERGLAHAATPHLDRMRRALALAERDAPATDAAVEATLLWMLDYWSKRGLVDECGGAAHDRYRPVDEWFVTRWLANGIPFALDVLAAMTRLDTDQSHCGEEATHALATQDRAEQRWFQLEQGFLSLLHRLRRGVVVHPDYKAGVVAAAKAREAAPVWLRAGIAFVFPDETAFFTADATAAVAAAGKKRTPPWSWGLVTTRLADDAQLRAILDSLARDDNSYLTFTQSFGFSLVSRLGDDAAPLLEHALANMRSKSSKQGFGEALALVGGTPPVVTNKPAKQAAAKSAAKPAAKSAKKPAAKSKAKPKPR
jgi:hypothetical protein